MAHRALSTVFPTIFKLVNEKTRFYDTLTYEKGYSLLAVDGTSLSIAYNADGSSYLETKGTNEYIVTALYDVMNKVYVDLDVRYKSKQYEVQSCIQMIGRNAFKPKTILTADRLYSTLNLYEHLNRKGLYYVIRCKTAKALWEINELEDEEQDVTRDIRVHTTQTKEDLLNTKNHISHQLFGESKFGKDNQHITWDFENHFSMTVRFVKFQLDSGEWEVLATNLPASEFSLAELKDLYHLRWEIETSFRSLKYDVGLISLHSRKEEFVVQDIYASFIAYNIGSRIQQIFNRTVIKDPKKAINISQAFYLVRVAFKDKVNPYSDIDTIIARYTIPKRPGRKDKRKEVKPKKIRAFEYRVA